MMNNYGFGKFEVLTVFVLILCIVAFLLYNILGSVSNQDFDDMIDSALILSKTVSTNYDTFHNYEVVYLNEVIDEGLLKKIKSPFSSDYCDGTFSKVERIDGKSYVTLKCNNYLIEKTWINNNNQVNIYEVGDWHVHKTSDEEEEVTLYNCLDFNGKEIFDEYLEPLYMIYLLNKNNGTDYYNIENVSNCTVVSNTFYRTKNLVEQ